MSEPQGAPAPAIPVVTAPAAPVVATAPAPVVPPTIPSGAVTFASTEQLNERLTRAGESAVAKALADLGVSDIAAAKAAIKAAADAAEANKTAEQRAAESAAKLQAEMAENLRKSGIIAEHAGRMMMALDADKQAAVKSAIKSVGGNPDDPTAQLGAISALSTTWNAAPAPSAPPAAQPATPPANTAPAPNAPPAAGSVSPTDPQQVYQSMAKQNPLLAAAYGISHMRDVYKTPNT